MSNDEGIAGGAPIYVVSGGVGQCAKQVVHTTLAQFPDTHLSVVTKAYVRDRRQLKAIIEEARQSGGTIVHTLVDGRLRARLRKEAAAAGVDDVDLFGDLMTKLTEVVGRAPVGRPGLYHQLRKDYFARVSAIDFTMSTDDGMSARDWPRADMVLVGPSRVGKTPLSIYLAMMGWKVANLPLVLDIAAPKELFDLDRRRVFGLVMRPERVVEHRRQRQRHLPPGCHTYAEPNHVSAEIDYTKRICRRGKFTVRDVTGVPIESTSRQLIELLDERFGERARAGAGQSATPSA